jgi:hypothetical protein
MAIVRRRLVLETLRPLSRLDVIALTLAAVAAAGLLVGFALREPRVDPRDCRVVTPDAARLSCYDQVIDRLPTEPARGANAPKL